MVLGWSYFVGQSEGKVEVYRYGIHLTSGLAEVRIYAAVLTSFLAGFSGSGTSSGWLFPCRGG